MGRSTGVRGTVQSICHPRKSSQLFPSERALVPDPPDPSDLYRPGTRGRRVFPAERPQEEPDTDPDSVDERDRWLLFREEREERRRLQVNNDN